MTEMSNAEIRRFLMQGTFTGKLATSRKDRGSHVFPIWFVLDNKSSRDEQKEVLKWATKIAERYVGKKNAKTYGKVNSSEGAVLVRIKPTRVIAEKDTSILD